MSGAEADAEPGGRAYDGPILDAHHHWWDRAMDRHPWLRPHGSGVLARSCLPGDYVPAARAAGVTGSVHVEANWDPSDPMGEIDWLDGLDRPDGFAARYVAHADLSAPGAAAHLERLAAHPRVTGVRDIVSWRPDPSRPDAADPRRMADPVFRQNVARLGALGLSFDLLMAPWQVGDASALLRAAPDTLVAINHCGSPFDRSAEGLALWAHGLRRLAAAPGAVLKLSNLHAYDPAPTDASLRRVLMAGLDAFGPGRCLIGSDHPVVELHAPMGDVFARLRRLLGDLAPDEARAVFHDNAAAFYRVPVPVPVPAGAIPCP